MKMYTSVLSCVVSPCINHKGSLENICRFVQNEDNHELEEMLGFPLLREGMRLGWLMNLNSVSRPHMQAQV